MRERLISLIEPALAGLGYELVDVEFQSSRSQALLRVYIDRPEVGIGIEDCERSSHALSALLDTADPIAQAYQLEVSSPGDDRVLRVRAHYERFAKERVLVTLIRPRQGRRRFTGTLQQVTEGGIELMVDGAAVAVQWEEIEQTRLAPLALTRGNRGRAGR